MLRGVGWFTFIDDESPVQTESRVAEHLSMCLADDGHSVLVDEDDSGGIVGYVAVHWLPYLMLAGPEGYVSELFAADSSRGLGLGTRLLEAVEFMAVSRG